METIERARPCLGTQETGIMVRNLKRSSGLGVWQRFVGKWCLGVIRLGSSREGKLEALSLNNRNESSPKIVHIGQQEGTI